MAWCDYCKAEKPGWVPVARRLPTLGRIVMVCYPSDFDGAPIYAFGARIDDGEGWCWGTKSYGGGDIRVGETARWNQIEVDDDYPVTHWMPLTRPPFKAKKKQPEAPALFIPRATEMNEPVIADATRKLAQTAIDMRQQRDDAEQALSQAYYLVTGRSPAWSDTFGHQQALEDIGDAVAALKLAVRARPPAAMSWGDGSLCVYGDGKSIAAVHAALTAGKCP